MKSLSKKSGQLRKEGGSLKENTSTKRKARKGLTSGEGWWNNLYVYLRGLACWVENPQRLLTKDISCLLPTEQKGRSQGAFAAC